MTDEAWAGGGGGLSPRVQLIWCRISVMASLIMLSATVQFCLHLSLNAWIGALSIIAVQKFPISNGISSVQWRVLITAFNMNETWDTIFGTKARGWVWKYLFIYFSFEGNLPKSHDGHFPLMWCSGLDAQMLFDRCEVFQVCEPYRHWKSDLLLQ